jgi:hypothetical protein
MSLEISSKMRPNARGVTEEVLERFPAVTQIWTYASFPDHSNCRCTDFMILGPATRAAEVALGNAIAAYLIKHADRLGVKWLIWNRRIWRAHDTGRGQGWDDYTGPKLHTDHVHVEVDDRTYQPPEDDMPSLTEYADAVLERDGQIENVFGDKGAGAHVALKTALKHIGANTEQAATKADVAALKAQIAALSAVVAKLVK